MSKSDGARVARAESWQPADAGLVGTPYFWTGVAGTVAVWGALMLALWI